MSCGYKVIRIERFGLIIIINIDYSEECSNTEAKINPCHSTI